MMNITRYAAIDIGSNAVRLLISNVMETETEVFYKKSSLIRVPVRLGIESFMHGSIGEETSDRLVESMKAFYHLMKANQVVHYKGCATSAMRDASNSQELIQRIKKEAGIDIEVISGKLEAEIIFSTHMEALFTGLDNFLYVDVGGGSTEITLFDKGVSKKSKSFNIGTLRVLEETVTEKDWLKMEIWLAEIAADYKDLSIIGSGGNINKMFKMSMKELGKPLNYKYLAKQYKDISALSYEDRMLDLDLNPDRADVIVPALEIYLNVMKWSKVDNVYVPKIGLSDGIARYAYKEYHKGSKSHKIPVFSAKDSNID
jgi:exopolyphosphatase/guanosine-5'-triphosphate,3'-diphosphate pyrophosphatase